MIKRATAKIGSSYLTYLLPAILVLFVVTIYPTIRGVWLSFHRIVVGGGGITEYVGFKNYSMLFRQVEVRNSFATTIVFVAGTVVSSFVTGFSMAILVRRQFPGKTLYMGLFILPVVATPVVSGMMWKLMLSTQFGIINWVISLIGLQPVAWLARGHTALLSVIVADVWQWSPFVMYLMIAALGALPREIEEAAAVDGVNRWQLWWHVNIPQLIPAITAVLLLRTIDAFKAFDVILMMTEGGPGHATQVLNLTAYRMGFRYSQLGKAAALGILVLIVVTIVSKLLLRLLRPEGA